MFKLFGTLICFAAASTLVCADDDKAAERRKEIETQKQQAEELWKGMLTGTQAAARKELPNIVLFGSVDENTLEKIGKGLEKALETARRNAAVKADTALWPGKLVVHICRDRSEFRSLYTKFKKETPDKDETGAYTHERDATIVLLGPLDAKKPASEVEGVIQVAAATLTKKTPRLPDWFVTGFSRSAAYRYAPNQFATERRRAKQFIAGKTAMDVWTPDKLSAEEAPVLTASLIDFLINSPQMAKLWPDVLNAMGEETAFEDALKAAKLTPERVDAAWRLWVGR